MEKELEEALSKVKEMKESLYLIACATCRNWHFNPQCPQCGSSEGTAYEVMAKKLEVNVGK